MPGGRDRRRAERLLGELDIITGSLEAATMVPYGEWGEWVDDPGDG